MHTVGKADLVRAVAEKTGGSQAAVKEVVEALLAEVKARAEAGASIRFSGFGSFQVKARPARVGRNPTTGAAIEIPESRKLTFKASRVA